MVADCLCMWTSCTWEEDLPSSLRVRIPSSWVHQEICSAAEVGEGCQEKGCEAPSQGEVGARQVEGEGSE